MPESKKELARSLRRKPTTAEAAMWKILRARRLGGIKFRRQSPMLGYIADFYSSEARLVIEIDGGYHDSMKEQDAKRDAVMRSYGLQVIRFRNEEVLGDLAGVKARLLHLGRTEDLKRQTAPNPPLLTVPTGEQP
jgi:very-short-patch-repair endonuclease